VSSLPVIAYTIRETIAYVKHFSAFLKLHSVSVGFALFIVITVCKKWETTYCVQYDTFGRVAQSV